MNDIGEFIEKLRKEKQITQKELGNRLNVSDKVISKWERGVYLPDIYMLAPVSKALGITVDELVNCKLNEEQKPDHSKKIIKLLIILLIITIFTFSFIIYFLNRHYESSKEVPEPYNVYAIESADPNLFINGYIIEKGTKYITFINKIQLFDPDLNKLKSNDKVFINLIENEQIIFNCEDTYNSFTSLNSESSFSLHEYRTAFKKLINIENVELMITLNSSNGDTSNMNYKVNLKEVDFEKIENH